jgi:hypothetical protein
MISEVRMIGELCMIRECILKLHIKPKINQLFMHSGLPKSNHNLNLNKSTSSSCIPSAPSATSIRDIFIACTSKKSEVLDLDTRLICRVRGDTRLICRVRGR